MRAEYDSVKIEPWIPQAWAGFEVTRKFRRVTCRITIKRAVPGNAVSRKADGKAIEGATVRPSAGGRREVAVEVVLG